MLSTWEINNVYIGLLRVQGRLKELLIIRGFITVSVSTLSLFIMSVYSTIAIGYVWLGVQMVVAIVLAFRVGTSVSRFSGTKGGNLEDVNHF